LARVDHFPGLEFTDATRAIAGKAGYEEAVLFTTATGAA
jgi:hypothetical protein